MPKPPPQERIIEQLDGLTNDELFHLSNHLLGLIELNVSPESELRILYHVLIVQSELLKRHGYGKPRKRRMRRMAKPEPETKVFRRKPPARPKLKRPGERDTSLTHNPFAALGKDKPS